MIKSIISITFFLVLTSVNMNSQTLVSIEKTVQGLKVSCLKDCLSEESGIIRGLEKQKTIALDTSDFILILPKSGVYKNGIDVDPNWTFFSISITDDGYILDGNNTSWNDQKYTCKTKKCIIYIDKNGIYDKL